jgi:hypothetical protein
MMRRIGWLGVTMAAMLAVLGGCAHERSTPAASDKAQEYRTAVAARPGMARIYVLPTYSKGLYSDLNGRATISIYPDGSSRGVRLASTARSMFVAFDIAPGPYDMVASAEVSIERVTKSLIAAPDTTYFLRPTFYRSAKDVPADPSQAMPGLGFDMVDPDDGRMEIQRMTMAAITPESEAFLARTMGVKTSAPTAAAPPAALPAPVVTAPSSSNFATVEQKLKDLQKLKNEGLITQQDYDERRRSILNAY